MKKLVKSIIVSAARNRYVQALFCNYNRKNVVFLGYHGICNDYDECEVWTQVRERNFLAQMDFLVNNFDCLSIDEALHDSKARRRPAVVVTFDDGYENNFSRALPILEKFGVPATIYITTGPIIRRELFWPDLIWQAAKRTDATDIDLRKVSDGLGTYHLGKDNRVCQKEIVRLIQDIKETKYNDSRNIVNLIVDKIKPVQSAASPNLTLKENVFNLLTEDHILALSRHPLITIGAHTHDHELLDSVPLSLAEQSITTSRMVLEKITGMHIKHFAYPNGNYNAEVMHMVERLGFMSAVCLRPGIYQPGNNKYAIKRIGIGSGVEVDLFRAITVGMLDLKWRFEQYCATLV